MKSGARLRFAGLLFLVSWAGFCAGKLPICFWHYADLSPEAWRARIVRTLGPRVTRLAYPEIPSVEQISLVKTAPQVIRREGSSLSPGLIDPVLEEARGLGAFEDFKILSDYKPRALSAEDSASLLSRAEAAGGRVTDPREARREFLKVYIAGAYEPGIGLREAPELAPEKWRIQSGNPAVDKTFAFVEGSWGKLVRLSPDHKDGSLLPTPFAVLIAAPGRFHESYYWDTYFMSKALLATGRLELAQMQAENLLEMIRAHGFVPNGMRDYYLSRSQPPFVSSLVREVVEASLAAAKTPEEREKVLSWVRLRALPLLQKDYHGFWMDPKTRFNAGTGLNHHWDDLDLPRPERHRFDDELAIGTTFRDTRAGAESGRDFTKTLGKDHASTAGVLLNSLLYKTERDLAALSVLLGKSGEEQTYAALAEKRKQAMLKYLWDDKRGQFENYNLKTGARIPLLSADGFAAPLFVELFDKSNDGDKKKLEQLMKRLPVLEEEGGIVASEVRASTHQWDRGPDSNAWAPDQVMAIQGLANYGYRDDARRLAGKWVDTIAKIHERHGGIYERADARKKDRPPVDESKYPVQGGKDSGGFGWTNGSFQWAALYLGHTLVPK